MSVLPTVYLFSVGGGSNLAPIGLPFLSSPSPDVSLANVILKFTNVDVSLAKGIFMGGNLALIGPPFLNSPALAVRLAHVILRSTNVDVSLASGILIFIGGQT